MLPGSGSSSKLDDPSVDGAVQQFCESGLEPIHVQPDQLTALMA
jgi:hypothetical protein